MKIGCLRVMKSAYLTDEELRYIFEYEEYKKTNKKIEYLNAPISFDIETSSFYENEENKRACMYLWTMNLNGELVIYGRYWSEFLDVIEKIEKVLETSLQKRVIIWIHNLSFEFQFFRKFFEWEKVFALDKRKVCTALTKSGIEFRCSFILSGYSLENLAKNCCKKYKCKKLTGELDYTKVRHAKSTLTEKEMLYAVNDVVVVVCYIRELIDQFSSIKNLPLTKTGFVRREVKNKCFKEYKKYRKNMTKMTLDLNEYKALRQAFSGGFTHANPFYSAKKLKNVKSKDITSSYPTVMLSEEFPCSRGKVYRPKDIDDLRKQFKCYCCIFQIAFENLQPKVLFDNYISSHKCSILKNPIINNGRVVSADSLQICITNIDFEIIEKYYTWDSFSINYFMRYRKNYLPKPIIETVLDFYEKKTKLKNVSGQENVYQNAKENLNSIYGMMVTNFIRDEIIYTKNDEWTEEVKDYAEEVERYNNSKGRFLFYPWGVFITAYARKNLQQAIFELENDYIYSDTDSVKYINYEKHEHFFEEYNKNIIEKCKECLAYYDLPVEKIEPETVDGIKKPIGVWDDEGIYTTFKTLGAKRYMVEKEGDISLTVSGINKKRAIPYIKEKNKNDIDKCFDFFSEDMYIPRGKSGKNTLTYIDEETAGTVMDYDGIKGDYHEYSSVHFEEAEYSLSLAETYLDYLRYVEIL